MALIKTTLAGCASVIAAGMLIAAPAPAIAQAVQTAEPTNAGLAAETLSVGESLRAIAMLSAELEAYPNDPALLINLGIAHAQRGNTAEARENFEAAMASRQVVELETANGSTIDSRRLARQAMAMLERGEFRPVSQNSAQLTLRD